MLNLTKPKYFIRCTSIACSSSTRGSRKTGIHPRRFVVENGNAVEFTENAKRRRSASAGRVRLCRRLGVGDVGRGAARRRHLSGDGRSS